MVHFIIIFRLYRFLYGYIMDSEGYTSISPLSTAQWFSFPIIYDTTRFSTEKRHSPVVSYIIGKLNHCAVDNGDIEVYPSESIIYPYKNL